MSLPAASPPIAVLVLAWDETTPAVRALVAAAETSEPALDSVVVLVPAGPAPAALTPEEFLPLEASIDLPLIASLIAPLAEEQPAAAALATDTPTAPAESPAADPISAATVPPNLPDTTAPAEATDFASTSFANVLAALPAVELPAPAPTGPTSAVLGWQGVRMLRLSSYSLATLAAHTQQALPMPAWAGSASVPAAPYLGSTPLASALPVAESFSGMAGLPSAALPALALPGAEPTPTPWETLTSAQHTAAIIPAYFPAEPAAPDAESDTAPTPTIDEPVPAAEASSTELAEEAAAELEETFTVDVTPVQAEWSDALASLQQPASPAGAPQPVAAVAKATLEAQAEGIMPSAPAAAAEPVAPPVSALYPPAQKFDAPNLNFQIIQYARFAVPLALAEPPFDVIYAPAWPTWLAAQELRYRTGQPLVLHIATLAAAEGEPIDLAAGWVAEIQRQALHRADLILTETPALAARLRHELALPAHRVRAVPAADADAVAQALRTARLSPPSL